MSDYQGYDLQEARDACRDFIVAWDAYQTGTGYHGPPAAHTSTAVELRDAYRKACEVLRREPSPIPGIERRLQRLDADVKAHDEEITRLFSAIKFER